VKPEAKKPSLIQSFIPLVILIVLLSLNVNFFGDDTLAGSNQMALILAAASAAIIAGRLGIKWRKQRDGIVKSIGSAMPSILILFLIGSLAGTWMISGVVPELIYYGLKILNPKIFLFVTVIICALVSLATGSSWSTVATIGIALLGIGKAMGMNEGMVAGAIISGAYFGDKMSPMSDTTNLAPAMAGTDLFTHIRYMLYTTVPSIVITLIVFLILGFTTKVETGLVNPDEVLNVLKNSFNLNPLLMIVPVFLIFIIIKKVAPVPALLAASLLGGIFAIIFQPEVINHVSGISDNYLKSSYIAVMKSMFGPVSIDTNNATVNELLSTNGMAGMLNTIWLIISAMVFGGVMESAGMLLKITQTVIKYVKSTAGLVSSTVGTCLFFNLTASDQYISIVVPGRMYAKAYKDRDLKPEVLSRTLEDSGTVTSVLIPWNTCGATQSSVLGVSTLTYAPYAFFNIISPFMSILMAVFNIKIRRYTDQLKNKKASDKDKN